LFGYLWERVKKINNRYNISLILKVLCLGRNGTNKSEEGFEKEKENTNS
jgi:hypothetical protein